jgi:glycosyltransferase involved in cell wall biosynthesis
MKLYEYLAAKRPIIASDLPQIREVLDNETSGLLVSPDDPASLASAVSRLAENPGLRDRLADSAFERHQSWNWDARAKAILDRAEHALGGISS